MTEIARETVREAVARLLMAHDGYVLPHTPNTANAAGWARYMSAADRHLSDLAALGLAVVLVEPTEAMLRKVRHEDYTSKTDLDWADGWRIMLEAARDE